MAVTAQESPMSLYARRPRLTPANPYFAAVRQAQHAASTYRSNSNVTILIGAKCDSEARALLEAKDKYPVYVQKVSCGNPHKVAVIDNEVEMAEFLRPVSGQSYVVVRPVAPPRARTFDRHAWA